MSKKISVITGIYKIASPSGGIYIGQAVNVRERWNKYKKLNSKNQVCLHRSFLKYGVENHVFEVIHECSEGELNDLEIHYIKLYDSFNTPHGLNLTSGGDSHVRFSDESKKRMSECRIGEKNHFFGKKHTEESLRIIGESSRLREHKPDRVYSKRSEESKRKNSESVTGEKNHFFGKTHTDESKNKISIANTGKVRSEKIKKNRSELYSGVGNPNYGKTHSVETKNKIGEKNRGKKRSKETLKKMSDASKGRKQSKETILKRVESIKRIKQEKLMMIF